MQGLYFVESVQETLAELLLMGTAPVHERFPGKVSVGRFQLTIVIAWADPKLQGTTTSITCGLCGTWASSRVEDVGLGRLEFRV